LLNFGLPSPQLSHRVISSEIVDNLSRIGLSPENWLKDFTSLSNEFEAEVIEEF
jgi:hypothetical protein